MARDRKLADIAPLLDVDDMVRMKNPDWKCVFTYVQSFYRRFAMQPKQPPAAASEPQQQQQDEEKAEEKHEEPTAAAAAATEELVKAE